MSAVRGLIVGSPPICPRQNCPTKAKLRHGAIEKTMTKHIMLFAVAGMTLMVIMPIQATAFCFWRQGTYWCTRAPKPPEKCTASKCTVTLSRATTSTTDLAGCGETADIGRLNLNFSTTDPDEVNRSDFHSGYYIHRISRSGGPIKFVDFEYSVNGGAWQSAAPTGIITAKNASRMGDNIIEFRARDGASIQGRVHISFYFSLVDPHRAMVEVDHNFYFTGGAGCALEVLAEPPGLDLLHPGRGLRPESTP